MLSMEERLLNEYFGNDEKAMSSARARLAAHEPLAYILGESVFYNETYKVTPDVLIPRPDTERVVDKIIEKLPRSGVLLDLCCGSGCIAVSSLLHTRATSALAVDISEKAIEIAKENAIRNNAESKVEFICSDIRDSSFLGNRLFDVIASNPPYVRSGVIDTLETECSFEPRVAFDGGDDGLCFYRLILDNYMKFLKPGGCMILEIGYDQANDIRSLCSARSLEVNIFRDWGGNERVAVIDAV